MAKETMSLTKALVRKKTLEDQIRSLTSEILNLTTSSGKTKTTLLTSDVIIGNSEKCKYTGFTKDEMKTSAEAFKTKVLTLIENYEALCKAISVANATTELEINGKIMTISDAIALKKNPIYELKIAFANKIYSDFSAMDRFADTYNADYCGSIAVNEYIKTVFGDTNNVSREELISTEVNFHKMRDASVVDVLNAESLYRDIYDDATNFKDEVDYKLSEINAKTEIDVEFAD